MQQNLTEQPNTKRHLWLPVSLLVVIGCATTWFFVSNPSQPSVVKAPVKNPVLDNTDRNDPSESYETFLHVLRTGGCENTRPAAIAWLDRYASQNLTLPNSQATAVLAMIENGAHPTWQPGYRQHIFNSAFNALHLCATGETFTRQLLHLSANDPDRTMRLYAMQHLGVQRRIGHLPDGALATIIFNTVSKIAHKPDEETSGYALEVLANWNGETPTQDPEIIRLALATAADTTRPNDVRISALFAAGNSALELARKLAIDPAQPVHLRKTAAACIGQYGNETDIPALQELSSESSRLAQAADPAKQTITNRSAKPNAPKLVPY